MNKPQSQELFDELYIKYSDKICESSETIFSGIKLTDMEQDYKIFMESTYSFQFLNEISVYEKNETIKCFIENEVLSELFTNTKDSLLLEGELSFSQQYLLDNTAEEFKVKYKNFESIEEGFGFTVAAGSIAAVFLGAIPTVMAGLFTGATIIGLNFLLPARYARSLDDATESMLGSLGLALIGTTSIFATSMVSNRLRASNNNIINFDNIDTNPEVRKLFRTLTNVPQQGFFTKAFQRMGILSKPSIDGINSIVASCLDSNDVLSNVEEINSGNASYLKGKHSPQNNNIFKVFFQSVFKSSTDKNSEEYNTLLRYRKCLSEKLLDLYKLLMISNVSQSRDYKKLTRIMQSGFQGNPEQILGFMHIDDEKDEILRENIMALIKFRMFLETMAKDLNKGIFEVDKESSIFLTQKLKLIDGEIESELKKRSREIETAFESIDEFATKDFKNDKVDEKKMKRKLWD